MISSFCLPPQLLATYRDRCTDFRDMKANTTRVPTLPYCRTPPLKGACSLTIDFPNAKPLMKLPAIPRDGLENRPT